MSSIPSERWSQSQRNGPRWSLISFEQCQHSFEDFLGVICRPRLKSIPWAIYQDWSRDSRNARRVSCMGILPSRYLKYSLVWGSLYPFLIAIFRYSFGQEKTQYLCSYNIYLICIYRDFWEKEYRLSGESPTERERETEIFIFLWHINMLQTCSVHLCIEESLQSHCFHTQFHWSSGQPVCFPSWGTWFQSPGRYLHETGILLLALSCFIGDPDMIDHCGLVWGGLRPEPSLGRHADNVIIPLDLTQLFCPGFTLAAGLPSGFTTNIVGCWGGGALWRACNLTAFIHSSTGPVVHLLASHHEGPGSIPRGVLTWNWDSPVSVVSLQHLYFRARRIIRALYIHTWTLEGSAICRQKWPKEDAKEVVARIGLYR
jgi:hypothetical protein